MACNVGVECIRYGGILSMGSHGAATHTRSLTDLVDTVKIIDASGTINTFSKEGDPVEFSAAALNLGLFGIIYTYTLRVEPMFKLQMRLIETIKTFTHNTFIKAMAKFPQLTPMISAHLCAKVTKNADQVLHAPNAIHFWGGMEHVPSVALEMAVKADENFENVVKSWSYVIGQVHEYAQRNEFPLNLMLEMRFLKASQMIMSNMYDEDPDVIFATMELVSAANTKGFEEFSAKMAQYWMENYRSQPHWAKMWEHIPGIVPYLQQQTGDRYKKFEEIRKKYDPQGMFMNGTFAKLLGH
ncbi:hypothetical protein BGZ83_006274 [Gryganskiella cystojenkinii]|nr:hypothetical protein BGZ83_006274 [Gryganskiella cystojenkinii]